ncbi:MAG: DUF2828 family protein [Oscillospiraceae bacterium]|nr:DUF2828 family protein [Oscillospiraceae bacterium]
MLNYLKKEANKALTENGAVTYISTCSNCLDLFATIGALRRESEQEIVSRFINAYAEDCNLAMKTLFFARDVRGGLGERRVFRIILSWLAANEPQSVRKNIQAIAKYGRWDDLLVLLDTPCEQDALRIIKHQLTADLVALDNGEVVSLLAKWLPSVNASNAQTVCSAKRIALSLGMKEAVYRKTLVKLRAHIRIIENSLREKDYSFDYEKQPSKAMFKYRKAFLRNDENRYLEFINRVSCGEATLHTGTLTPYDIIAPFFDDRFTEIERRSINATWNAQEDFTGGENALVVIDGSGSMYQGSQPLPAAVALSLGIYFAERNTGTFKNHFITFSMHPQLVEIKGRDILEKVGYCCEYDECANTDIQKVFELVLFAAVKNKVPQSELPKALYIISDMEFDCCAYGAQATNFEYAKSLFAAHGYELPQVVFWNVASRNRQQPVTKNEQGVALVSGCTPRIFSMLQSGTLNPYAYMMEILESERYREIAA